MEFLTAHTAELEGLVECERGHSSSLQSDLKRAVTVILVRQGFWSEGPTSPRKRADYNGPGWGLWSGRMGDQFRRDITGPPVP